MSNLIETRTARVHLRSDGIIQTTIFPGAKQSLTDAKENLGASIQMGQGIKRPLLVDISRAEPLEPETRHYYTGKLLLESFTALGLLVEGSPFGRMMGNVYLRVARPGIPTQLFASEEQVLAWLRKYLE